VGELVTSSADTIRLFAQDEAITRLPSAVTAFVGRTLKGPVHEPVTVAGFNDFQRIFGGLWQPATLSYAIEQFFENGGRRAVVVRVDNGGRPPSLTLPSANAALTLIGLYPGTREYLRASVDYDGIDESHADCFNLVVQRLRAPGSEFIEDQEIFRRVSVFAESDRFVADALAKSRLVRAHGTVPRSRPRLTPGSGGAAVGYVAVNPDGDDGGVLSDYDLIGDPVAGTGLFALAGAQRFDLLYVPPLERERDVGFSTLLVALRLCRARHAMLVVDPPIGWSSAARVLQGLRDWPFRSEDALMSFPRVQAFDRLRGRFETFAGGGATAGMIARAEEACPVWSTAQSEEQALRPMLRPAVEVDESERWALTHAGVNVLHSTRAPNRAAFGLRTLMPESGVRSGARNLATRRLALFIMASVEQGTRWVVYEHSSPPLWTRVVMQVREFLEALAADGVLVGAMPEERHFVICDERLNAATETQQGALRLLFGFAALRPGDFRACLVTHRPGGSATRTVSVNRLALAGRRIETEFETAILRGLIEP
jgi:phage tail sheath protein FI